MGSQRRPTSKNESNRKQRESTGLRWLGVVACVCAAAAIIRAFVPGHLSDQSDAVAADPVVIFPDHPDSRPTAVQSDGYVGSQACRKCHQREFDTWHSSYHHTMTQVPTAESVVGDFNDVDLKLHGHQFHMGRDKEQFWAEFDNPSEHDGRAKTNSVRKNIVLCTGSHHMQVYWVSTGNENELACLPFTWLIDDQRWVPRLSTFLMPPDDLHFNEPDPKNVFEFGRWNSRCIHCHTTHGQPHLDGLLSDATGPQSTVADFGISCEACHGPAESHVQTHSIGSDARTETLVVPSKLNHARSSEVCGQCHFVRVHTEERILQLNASGDQFRPGNSLRDGYHLHDDLSDGSRFWADGMIRVTGREFNGLMESPCFQHGEMSCFSCHTMHKAADDIRSDADWTDDQLKPLMRTSHACLQCHTEYEAEAVVTAHTHHMPDSHGSECQNCHMPNSTYGLLKMTRSHQISSPDTHETLSTGRANACNLCHLDRTLPWADQHLAEWYGHKRQLPNDDGNQIAAAVLMALTGDPGVRAMTAWHMGWKPAREVSGEGWAAPYLAILMQDEYDAVRYIAHRSLNQIGGYDDINFDFTAAPPENPEGPAAVMLRWSKQNGDFSAKPALLIAPRGGRLDSQVGPLLQSRSTIGLFLNE
jgi:hypothetical protein